jgi:hypothetical protein
LISPRIVKGGYRAKDGTEEKVLDTFGMKLNGKTGNSKSFDMKTLYAILKEISRVMTMARFLHFL